MPRAIRAARSHRESFMHAMSITVALLAISTGAAFATGFLPTGALGVKRARAAAAMAGDKVLVAGGSSFGGFCLPVSLAELYDPAAGTFSATGPLKHTRCEARAVALDDGRVLVVGGAGQGRGDAEVFDPQTETFTLTGPLGTDRLVGFTLTKLGDGRVLVAGGDELGGPIATAEIFDPDTNGFVLAGALVTPRSMHTATLLDDGRVLLAGGGAGAICQAVSRSAEIFDPLAGSSSATVGDPVSSLWGHAGQRLPSGKVLLAGGEPTCGLGPSAGTRSAEIFDPATGSFSTTGDMVDVHGLGLAATSLGDGRVLLTGGIAVTGPVAGGELFDPDSGSFGAVATMSSPRAFHAQVGLPDGTVLVAGGEESAFGVTMSADIYSAQAPLMEARVDVVPNTINLRSRGRFITVFIGVPGHEAGEIDVPSIVVSVDGKGALSPVGGGWGIGDHDGDGVSDMMFKLSRADVVDLAPMGRAVPFKVMGSLKNGTSVGGTDRVRVICPGRGTCGSAAASSKLPR